MPSAKVAAILSWPLCVNVLALARLWWYDMINAQHGNSPGKVPWQFFPHYGSRCTRMRIYPCGVSVGISSSRVLTRLCVASQVVLFEDETFVLIMLIAWMSSIIINGSNINQIRLWWLVLIGSINDTCLSSSGMAMTISTRHLQRKQRVPDLLNIFQMMILYLCGEPCCVLERHILGPWEMR